MLRSNLEFGLPKLFEFHVELAHFDYLELKQCSNACVLHKLCGLDSFAEYLTQPFSPILSSAPSSMMANILYHPKSILIAMLEEGRVASSGGRVSPLLHAPPILGINDVGIVW